DKSGWIPCAAFIARSHEMTTRSLTAEDGGIKNPGNFFRPRSPPGADPSRWRMAKPPDDDSPASGVSRRTFLKTAGVGAAATSLIGAAPGASGPAVLGPDAVPLALKINGAARTVTVEPRVTLLR